MTQDEFITILFNDNRYALAQQKAWLDDRFGKRYVDELTTAQKSKAIELLKEAKGLGV